MGILESEGGTYPPVGANVFDLIVLWDVYIKSIVPNNDLSTSKDPIDLWEINHENMISAISPEVCAKSRALLLCSPRRKSTVMQ